MSWANSRVHTSGGAAMTSGNDDPTPAYLFDQAREAERTRLRGLEAYYDAVSTRWLERTGVGAGWRCLEVGGGAGSIARWLAARLGPTGHLVVTDLDVRFLEELRSDRVEVRRHDITREGLEPGAFDLVHTRAVLMHLRGGDRALERILRSLRPGGWLVVEEADYGETAARAVERYLPSGDARAAAARINDATIRAVRSAGGDPEFGSHLMARFVDFGLEEVDVEFSSRLVRGGSDRASFMLHGARVPGAEAGSGRGGRGIRSRPGQDLPDRSIGVPPRSPADGQRGRATAAGLN
jgi:SAM-dependent methyltransferase